MTLSRSTLWLLSTCAATAACSATDGGPGPRSGGASAGAPSVALAKREGGHDGQTRSPIKHVIVIVGENRTFDHVYATYKPKGKQRIWNLLSRGIIQEDGSPGPQFSSAVQVAAKLDAKDGYRMTGREQTPYAVLPAPLVSGPKVPTFTTLADARRAETALPDEYLASLTRGGTGLDAGAVDTRIRNARSLPPGPFPLTPGIAYEAYTGGPVHRFYQMWQELDCAVDHATAENPSGCKSDQFAWVETSVGAGSNGSPPPSPFTDATTGEGATALGFYNVLAGDAPYLKTLADQYAMSDNFHQAVQGGTGANHVALGTGDAVWFSDGAGHAATPPALNTENPNPQPGTNNFYVQDGYSGGTYSQCADPSQPGVGPVVDYLKAMHVNPNCEAGHYYLLNNYAPGYRSDGTVHHDPFAIPPSSLRTIGDELSERDVSWRYYGDHYNRNVKDPAGTDPNDQYCDICNPFQYATSIMADPVARTTHLKDTDDLYADIARGWLPAFSIVKPSGLVDGHPSSSKLDLFEGFSKKLIDAVHGNTALWEDTVVFVTFDEGGGYYDSGYVAPVDFFGDGTRIPLIAVSPWATGGRVSHHYADHVSILKFVERNWALPPVTNRSRDNLPNPVASPDNPWVPRNGAAIDDLFDLFTFGRGAQGDGDGEGPSAER